MGSKTETRFRVKIVEGSVISVLEYDVGGKMIFPSGFRDQRRCHKGSCFHHSLCTVIEHHYYKKAKVWGETFEERVDVGLLIRLAPPPVKLKKFFRVFLENQVGGDGKKGLIRAESMEYPFKLCPAPSTYRKLSVSVADDYDAIIRHFTNRVSPAVGCFRYTFDHKPVEDHVFVNEETDNKAKQVFGNCPRCGASVALRHSVCVTGIAWGDFGLGVYKQLFQYLCSDKPGKVHYMTCKSMDTIVIPCLM